MARENKDGINYFPLDIRLEDDDKVSMIIGEFGYKGEMIWIKLLSWIYEHRGYYVCWDEKEQLKFAKRVAYISGSSANLPQDVVIRCIKWELFNEDLFNMFNILTSERIQETWFEATRKRKVRNIIPEYWLKSNDKTESSAFAAEESSKKAEVNNKVNKSKVNKSKVNNNDDDNIAPPSSNFNFKPVEPPPLIKPFYSLPDLKQIILRDSRYCERIYMKGMPHGKLPDWLDAFHRILEAKGENAKQEPDYRTHFLNWLNKQDYVSGNPALYSPLKQPATTQPQQPESEATRKLKAKMNGA